MQENSGFKHIEAGNVFSLAKQNPWAAGCTLSGELINNQAIDAEIFSLAPGTQISPESYATEKMWLVLDGSMKPVWFDAKKDKPREGSANASTADAANADSQKPDTPMGPGDALIVAMATAAGVRSDVGCIYLDIQFKERNAMNDQVKSGEVFKLADLLPYQEDKIVNMDIVDQDDLHFALMSFSAGTSLKEHAAPGEAIVFALDGDGIIGYEGKEYPIHAGENFKFDKGGKHYVKAVSNFKMALLLVTA